MQTIWSRSLGQKHLFRMMHGRSFIGIKIPLILLTLLGRERVSEIAKDRVIYAYNPKTNEKLETPFYEANQSQVNEAVINGEKAFLEFKKKTPQEVSHFLKEIATQLQSKSKEIIDRGMLETGYPEPRITGELGRTVTQIQMFADLVKERYHVEARIIKQEGKPDLRRMLIPIGGPIAVFGASNFPLAFSAAGGDTISALAAQCPVIVKGHPAHPGLSELVSECILRAQENTNMPNFIYSMLHGNISVGEQLVLHPSLKAVGFTGSLKAGRALFNLANSRENPIPVFAEMGSVNPVFILPDALKTKSKEIAEGLATSATLSSGQFCTKPGIVITIGDQSDFLSHLKNSIEKIPPNNMLTNGMKQSFEMGLNQILNVSDVKLVAQAKTENSNFTTATVVTTDHLTFVSNQLLHQEVFGPMTIIVNCSSIQDALKIANHFEGQLTGTIHCTTQDNSEEIMNVLSDKVGRLLFNGFPTGVEVCSAMNHGGPYPSTTFAHFTSVGTEAIKRWLRPICYQNVPHHLLPKELQNENEYKTMRLVNNVWSNNKIE